ncbi:MAG: MNIO family bufferin maturase [Hyphomicrobium sp.]
MAGEATAKSKPRTVPKAKSSTSARPPYLGFGLGLRAQHYADILDGDPPVDWFEVISENYMVPGGQPLKMLDRIRARYPIVMHGVSLSIASTAPFDQTYLDGLKALAERTEPVFVSDHLCWTGVHGVNLHDLLPLPYTRESLDHVVARVQHVQDFLKRPFVLENVSTYVQFAHSEMPEWEFLSELTRRTGCYLLLDVNNVYVSAFNHEFDAYAFLAGIPADRVVQFHLAGHEHNMTHIIDTHDAMVCDDVWKLYRAALERFGHVSTIIERDDDIPPLADMVSELGKAREIAAEVLRPVSAARG